jgi:hypothetical protein
MKGIPVVKNIGRKEAQEVAKAARSKAEGLRQLVEYPDKLADIIGREALLQVEVFQLTDQATSDLPNEKLIEVNELLDRKATKLADLLKEKKKIQALMAGKSKKKH